MKSYTKKEINKIREKILNSGIDFSKKGYIKDISKFLNKSYDITYYFLRNYMTDFYNDKCFRRCFRNNNNEIKKKLFESGIDFSKKGWSRQVSELMDWQNSWVHRWMRTHLPEFYKSKCYKERKRNNKCLVKKILNSSIDFFRLDWVDEVSKILSLSPEYVGEWMRRHMLEFYNNECYHIVRTNETKIKRLILNSDIDFSKRGWIGKASTLTDIYYYNMVDWMKKNMPSFYNDQCCERKKPNKKVVKREKEFYLQESIQRNKQMNDKLYQKIMKENIDFSTLGWEKAVTNVIGGSQRLVNCWLRRYFRVKSFEDMKQYRKKLSKRILEADIDYTKWGWQKKLSKLLNMDTRTLIRWLKRWMPEFYEKYNIASYLKLQRQKIEQLQNVDINFNNWKWTEQASNITGIKSVYIVPLMKKYIPEFYRKNCIRKSLIKYKNKGKKRQSGYISNIEKVKIKNSDIDFSQRGYSRKLAKLLNRNEANIITLLKKNMPEFHEKYCYKNKRRSKSG